MNILSVFLAQIMLPPLVVHILWSIGSIIVVGVIIYILYLICAAIFSGSEPLIWKVAYILFLVCLLIIVLYAFIGGGGR